MRFLVSFEFHWADSTETGNRNQDSKLATLTFPIQLSASQHKYSGHFYAEQPNS